MIQLSLKEPAVFSAIFDRHFDSVYAYLARRIGVARAEDLAASTFTVAFERRHRFRAEASTARPWLLGIASNLLRNERRAEKRALRVIDRLGAHELALPPDDGMEAPRLGPALSRLDRDQRDVLLLYAWEELSYQEIAAALDIPVGTVRSRLARARARLRSLLDNGPNLATGAQEVSG